MVEGLAQAHSTMQQTQLQAEASMATLRMSMDQVEQQAEGVERLMADSLQAQSVVTDPALGNTIDIEA